MRDWAKHKDDSFHYRYVLRKVYEAKSDRLESKIQRLKGQIRDLQDTVSGLEASVEKINQRAAVFVMEGPHLDK